MLVSPSAELEMDRQWAPHQFSADYGAAQDAGLNAYVSEVGRGMARVTHRPDLSYNFRVVNAPAVNGYTFPAGSVGLARGLMLAMENEAQLAAVLGHEMGHVNARHTGARMSKAMVAMWVVSGITAYVRMEREQYADLAAGLGAVGAQALLARYSRDNEREADALGMGYASAAEHNPGGMVEMMRILRRLQQSRPNAVALIFATHPLTDERLRTASAALAAAYAGEAGRDAGRERFMDRTAALRAMSAAVESMQAGEQALMTRRPAEARTHFARALRQAPDDYAALLMAAKCALALKDVVEAERLAAQARLVYPGEPQALHVAGLARVGARKFEAALADFQSYERMLPGNPNTLFFKGYCCEQMGRRREAAEAYRAYLQAAPSGEYAGHARRRLGEWNMLPAEETGS